MTVNGSYVVTMSGSAAPTGLQFTLQLSGTASVQSVSVVPGTVLATATKNLICGNYLNAAMKCVIISQSGTNATIADGVVATFTIITGSGSLILTIPSQSDESMTGSTVTLPSISSSMGAPNLCDVSRDGTVDTTDLDIITRWVLGTDVVPAGATCDINADSVCDILDAIIVGRYIAVGGTCP